MKYANENPEIRQQKISEAVGKHNDRSFVGMRMKSENQKLLNLSREVSRGMQKFDLNESTYTSGSKGSSFPTTTNKETFNSL